MTTIYEGRSHADSFPTDWQPIDPAHIGMWRDLCASMPGRYEMREAPQIVTLAQFCEAGVKAGLFKGESVVLTSSPPQYRTYYSTLQKAGVDVTKRLTIMAHKLGIYK